jgi:ribosomal-protein-alanine N-acetyltransferase
MTLAPTERLYFRPLQEDDAPGMFELDSNPAVHRYLGRQPLSSLAQSQEIIRLIQAQYRSNGIGRWAVLRRDTKEFMGWAGLKLVREPVNGHQDFYDLGYRFIERYWGQGYGYEAAQAWLNHGFEVLQLPVINAYVDFDNQASRRILEKAGLCAGNEFEYEGDRCLWYEARNPSRPV